VFGIAYGIAHFRTAEQRHQEQAQTAAEQASNVRALAPELLPRAVARGIAMGDAPTTCDLLGAPARDQLAASLGASDCAAAVHQLAAQVTDSRAYASPRVPPSALVKQPGQAGQPGSATLDGCQASWLVPSPGPKLGRFTLTQFQQGDRYLVTGYAPCR